MGKSTLKVIEQVPSKKRKYSKNKKKNWKKYIDVSDIQKQQQSAAEEQIDADYIKEHQTDDIVFDFEETQNTTTKNTSLKGEKTCNKPLRCQIFLDGLPGAKPPSKPQGFAKTDLPKAVRTVIRRSKNRHNYKKKQEEAKKSQLLAKKHRTFLSAREFMTTTGDLWKKKPLLSDKKNEEYKSYISEGYKHFLRVTKTGRVTTKNRYHNPSDIPSVIVPNPGAAYNPSFHDHQKLVSIVAKKEEKRLAKENEEKERHKEILAHRIGKPLKVENRPKNNKQSKKIIKTAKGKNNKPQQKNESSVPKTEKLQDITSKGTDKKQKPAVQKNVTSEDQMLRDEGQVTRAVPGPKTRRQKGLEILKKKMKLKKLKSKTLHKQQEKVDKIGLISSRLNKEESRKNKLQAKNKLNKLIEDRFKTKRLHPILFKDQDIHVPLSDQLVGSIREIKPTQASSKDLFVSLQRRNRIEVRAPKKKPIKKKRKLVNKRKAVN